MPRLGRGLESLLPKSFVGAGRSIVQIPVNQIHANPYQPRKEFDRNKIEELAQSIKKHGLAQPIIVREINNSFQLVAGERRLRACILAKFEVIPAIIKHITDQESAQLAIVENLDRENLNAIETATGYEKLIKEFNYTHKQLSELFGRSRSSVTNSLRLLQLPAIIKDGCLANLISEGHARCLLQCDSEEKMFFLYKQTINESLSVRELEKLCSSDNINIEKTKKEKATSPAYFESYRQKFKDKGIKATISGTSKKGKISLSFNTEAELETLYQSLQQQETLFD